MTWDVPCQWPKRPENGADRGRDVGTTPSEGLTKSIAVKADGAVGDQLVDPAAHIGYACRVVEQDLVFAHLEFLVTVNTRRARSCPGGAPPGGSHSAPAPETHGGVTA